MIRKQFRGKEIRVALLIKAEWYNNQEYVQGKQRILVDNIDESAIRREFPDMPLFQLDETYLWGQSVQNGPDGYVEYSICPIGVIG